MSSKWFRREGSRAGGSTPAPVETQSEVTKTHAAATRDMQGAEQDMVEMETRLSGGIWQKMTKSSPRTSSESMRAPSAATLGRTSSRTATGNDSLSAIGARWIGYLPSSILMASSACAWAVLASAWGAAQGIYAPAERAAQGA